MKTPERQVKVAQLCPTLCNPRDYTVSRPEYCNGQPFPSPGDLPSPGIKPRSPAQFQACMLEVSHWLTQRSLRHNKAQDCTHDPSLNLGLFRGPNLRKWHGHIPTHANRQATPSLPPMSFYHPSPCLLHCSRSESPPLSRMTSSRPQ